MTLPLSLSGLLLVGIPMLLAMAGPIIVRLFLKRDRLSPLNDVAGFKFATLRAVLLAFVVIIAWENFREAESDVLSEAGAAATIYRLVDVMDSVPRAAPRDSRTSSLRIMLEKVRDAMTNGKGSPAVTRALDRLHRQALDKPADLREARMLSRVLDQRGVLTEPVAC
jgi:hypothetical protein